MWEIVVTRDTAWPDGTPCWVDLGVNDIARASAFYAGLFGWDIQPGRAEAGGYTMCWLNGRPVAGIGPERDRRAHRRCGPRYLAADNADETAAKTTKAGGQLFMDPFNVMDVGRMVVAADPGGAVFGIWQARAHTGVGLANEPGTLCWNENHTRDFDRNKAFYQAVFGYELGDIGGADIRYATLKLGGREVGGIMELDASGPTGVPAHWETYFAVSGTDAAVAAVAGSGGSVIRPPWDTPYGRMAIVTDDQGAEFSVITPAGLSRRGPGQPTGTGASSAISRSAVRATVRTAHRPVVSHPRISTASPQPVMIHQPTWLASAKPACSGPASTEITADPTTATPSDPHLAAGGCDGRRHPGLSGRHPGHRGVRDRRVHQPEPGAEEDVGGQQPADRGVPGEAGQHRARPRSCTARPPAAAAAGRVG